ncbi:Ig-like domain-containing protein, partial [bacterium]|nr:Ig-like domain-containing protein [bacterium]
AIYHVPAFILDYVELDGHGFYGPYEGYWEHAAYTRGAYTPAELPSPGAKSSITKTAPPEPHLVNINAYSAPLVSLVKDADGNPAENITLIFSISKFPDFAVGQELTKTSEQTNSQGLADVLLQLGNIPAEYGVTAKCETCASETSSVTFTCCGKLPNDNFSQTYTPTSPWNVDCYARHNCNIEPKTTIGYLGCGPTSLATLINYYSDNVHATIPRTNPGQLNIYLRGLPNYQGYNVDNDVDFNAIEEYSNGLAFYIDRYDVDDPYSREALLTMADDMILTGSPIMFRIGGHFVLAIGKCGDSYIIADPIGGVERLYNPDNLNDREFSGIRIFYHY